jgi:hypothetical protein
MVKQALATFSRIMVDVTMHVRKARAHLDNVSIAGRHAAHKTRRRKDPTFVF